MRIYIIGVMVGAIGLVAANQVRADEHCRPKSGKAIEALHGTMRTDSSASGIETPDCFR